jgi:3-oxoacyl-[acyl-carrier protein] reductase
VNGRLSGQTAVVIGAAQGIGAAVAERFVDEGAFVTVGDINEELGRALVKRLGRGSAQFKSADVSCESDVNELVSFATQHNGRVDILVQNAGIYPLGMIEDMPKKRWDEVLSINLGGTFLAAKACLPVMRGQKTGRMIFTSSITGTRVVNPAHACYAATKAGINGFIKAAAIEFAGYGITVNGVEPGNILTEGLTVGRSPAYIAAMKASIPLGRLGSPLDVANAVVFLASEEASYITGTTILIDGGQTLPESKDFHVA